MVSPLRVVSVFVDEFYGKIRKYNLQEKNLDFNFRFMYLNVLKMITKLSKHVAV